MVGSASGKQVDAEATLGGRPIADASHELRTPLTIIRGELETLLLDKSLSNNVRETIYSLVEETRI